MQDIPDLLEGLRRSASILSSLVDTIPADKMNLRRGDGFWTIAEHVSHLAGVQLMLLERIQRFMDDAASCMPVDSGEETGVCPQFRPCRFLRFGPGCTSVRSDPKPQESTSPSGPEPSALPPLSRRSFVQYAG